MPTSWQRRPIRVALEPLRPLALLAAAFILIWAVILQPMWQRSRGPADLAPGQPTLAARAVKPT